MVDVAKVNQALGKLIRDKREQHGWTQEHLAREVGVSQGLVSSWEKGKIQPFGHPVYKVLGVTEEEVMAAMAAGTTDDPVEQALAATRRIDPKIRNALLTLYRYARDRGDEDLVAATVSQ